jgi:hypothetical protein
VAIDTNGTWAPTTVASPPYSALNGVSCSGPTVVSCTAVGGAEGSLPVPAAGNYPVVPMVVTLARLCRYWFIPPISITFIAWVLIRTSNKWVSMAEKSQAPQ